MNCLNCPFSYKFLLTQTFFWIGFQPRDFINIFLKQWIKNDPDTKDPRVQFEGANKSKTNVNERIYLI